MARAFPSADAFSTEVTRSQWFISSEALGPVFYILDINIRRVTSDYLDTNAEKMLVFMELLKAAEECSNTTEEI